MAFAKRLQRLPSNYPTGYKIGSDFASPHPPVFTFLTGLICMPNFLTMHTYLKEKAGLLLRGYNGGQSIVFFARGTKGLLFK